MWPAVHVGPSEALAAYMGLQALVIAALFWTFRRTLESRRDLLKAGAWAMPLLAVPAVC